MHSTWNTVMAAHGECRNGILSRCLLYANTCVYNYILCIIIHVLIFIDMNKTHCTTIECDLHNHYMPWTVCRSSCGRTVTVRLVHVASADLSSTDLAGLHEYAVGRCATQYCVIVLGDIDDGLLAMNACTFLVNYVVSLYPLGLYI